MRIIAIICLIVSIIAVVILGVLYYMELSNKIKAGKEARKKKIAEEVRDVEKEL